MHINRKQVHSGFWRVKKGALPRRLLSGSSVWRMTKMPMAACRVEQGAAVRPQPQHRCLTHRPWEVRLNRDWHVILRDLAEKCGLR